ncbi:hypothetical protein QR680_011025 [Steinernema hermaphroditum]|uniref:E1 domain-containing protein n=1 Tax=Steinernema hermaphroditum TaxID=289476 RepID=A0AA39ITM8_9BILA|nr:hypothetical protein QR680_011025 [Steinernema hermaphroditum]
MRLAVLALLALYGALPEAYGSRRAEEGAFAPMVAMADGYRSRYLTEDLKWITDPGKLAYYTDSTLDVLRYCRLRYSNRNITSVVEAAHEIVLGDWVTYPKNIPSGLKLTVKPWRCVEGKFSTEIVYHPQGCPYRKTEKKADFDACYQKDYWKSTAEKHCSEIGKKFTLYSFAMSSPCGVDYFKAVDYVCCPNDFDMDSSEKDELHKYRRIIQEAHKKFTRVLEDRDKVISKYNEMVQTNGVAAEDYYNKELAKLDQRNKEIGRERARQIHKIGFDVDKKVMEEMENAVDKDVLGAFNKVTNRYNCEDTITTTVLKQLARKRSEYKKEIEIRAELDHDLARDYAERIALTALNFIDRAAKKVFDKCPVVGRNRTEELYIKLITQPFDFPVKWATYYNANEIFLHLFGKKLGFYANDKELFDAHGLPFKIETVESKKPAESKEDDYSSEEEDEEEETTTEPKIKKKEKSIPTFIFLSTVLILTPIFICIGVNVHRNCSRTRNFHKISGDDMMHIMTEDEYNDDSIDEMKMNLYTNPHDRLANSLL